MCPESSADLERMSADAYVRMRTVTMMIDNVDDANADDGAIPLIDLSTPKLDHGFKPYIMM
jgi:hypothetical protein